MRYVAVVVALGSAALGCSSSEASPGSSDAVHGGPRDDAAVDTDASPGAETWDGFARQFFAAYCVSCHDSSDSTGRDFTKADVVKKNAAEIRCGVAVGQDPIWGCATFPPPKQFPIGSGPKPTDEERARIVAWITAGDP